MRAATGGSPVQQTNCHPFRFGRWLFLHNGRLRGFDKIRRDLVFAVGEELYPHIEGTTDSEVMFHLALTFGLQDDPVGALERMVGLVEATGREAGIEKPMQMTVGLTNGHAVYAVRYSTDHGESDFGSRTLFHSRSMSALKQLNPRFDRLSDDAIVVVSEPLNDVLDYWEEIPESTAITVSGSTIETREFAPVPPA